jgi:hypothetical protein
MDDLRFLGPFAADLKLGRIQRVDSDLYLATASVEVVSLCDSRPHDPCGTFREQIQSDPRPGDNAPVRLHPETLPITIA